MKTESTSQLPQTAADPCVTPVGPFPATQWTLVLAARQKDVSQAQAALETLCKVYWRPLYVYARRFGHSPHDAEDLT